jgi:translation initiation factor IF-2
MNGTEAPREEKLIGKITHYFGKIGVAVIEITEGELKSGDMIHLKGGDRDFDQKVDSMQVEHQAVEMAKQGESVGLKVDNPVREGDEVFKVLE